MADVGSIIDGGANTAQGREGITVQTFALSLVAGFVLFCVQFTAFAISRNYFWAKKIYQPRSYLIPLKNRVDPPPNNIFRWFIKLLCTRAENEVLQKAGMDAYFFVKYVGMCLKMFVPLALVILPILLPVNAVHGKGDNVIAGVKYNVTGLDILAWSNVSPQHTSKYWAHLVLAICAIAWVCFLFHEELKHYVVIRQEYLGSASHRLKASSTTVLITDIPDELCTTKAITELYDDLPGGIRRIWFNRNYGKIQEKDVLRKKIEGMLEDAETNLVRLAVKRSRKSRKGKTDSPASNETQMVEEELSEIRTTLSQASQVPITTGTGNDRKPMTELVQGDLQRDINSRAAWTRYLSQKDRKSIRIAKANRQGWFKVPLIGRFFSEKLDAIYYYRRELARLNEEIEADIDQAESCPLNRSVFIQFNTQKAAHLACQAVAATRPREMLHREVEISPGEINWSSLDLLWRNRAIRLIVFLALFLLLIFVFGLISFFTGILSRLSTLAHTRNWLSWIQGLPSWLLSFIQGTLPSVIIVIVLSGPTPIVLRAMTNSTRGAITRSEGERSLQLWYFIFLVLQVLIIPTISSGLTSIVQGLLSNPTSAPNILATNLPTASNYFFSLLIIQALSFSASSIFQTVRLLNHYVFNRPNTPDDMYQRSTFTHFTRIGSNIPWYTTFAVIGLVYSIIAPLILVFCLITFSLFYMVIKNNVLYVVRTGDADSGGLWFPSAINQTFTGLYLMEFCLSGLFFLVHDAESNLACEAQGIIMAACIVLTICYQVWLNKNFNALLKYCPLGLDLVSAQHGSEHEIEHLNPSGLEGIAGSRNNEKSDGNFSQSLSKTSISNGREVIHSRPDSKPSDRRSTILSTTTEDRTTDLQTQREHDKTAAKHILARLNRPLDDTDSPAQTTMTSAAPTQSEAANDAAAHNAMRRRKVVEARIGHILLPQEEKIVTQMMNDPISRTIMQHNDELEDLTEEERDMLISVAFTHPLLRENKPCVWIPRDEIGVSDDEVRRTRQLSDHVFIENRGAYLDKKLKVRVNKSPPDMSSFALVMAEL